jgi:hypothetical protein
MTHWRKRRYSTSKSLAIIAACVIGAWGVVWFATFTVTSAVYSAVRFVDLFY